MKVFGAEVARWMRSAAARGEEADLVSARKGYMFKMNLSVVERKSRRLRLTSRALRALVCSIFQTCVLVRGS